MCRTLGASTKNHYLEKHVLDPGTSLAEMDANLIDA